MLSHNHFENLETVHFTISDHISILTRSCYFHPRRLRAIRRSITPTVFATILLAFICSRIDYCHSLLVGLPKSRLSAIQSVLNSSSRLIARLPRFTHISTYMTEVLLLLPIASRIKFNVLLLVSKSQPGLAPRYILLTLCINQCLQHLPALCALLIA